MDSKQYLLFNNGYKMPSLGLGTWRAPDNEVEAAVNLALEIGYRHIDTAPVYLNEKTIGKVLKTWIDSGKVKREDLFIVTKLPPNAMRPENVEKHLQNSLNDLQLSYVDLYLIHVPFGLPEITGESFKRNENGETVIDETTNHLEIWRKLEEMVEKRLTRSIGVSNFNKNQIEKILNNCTIQPVNLQIELHVYLQQNELVNFCKQHNIIVTAYSPLGSIGIDQLMKSAGVECEIPKLLEDSTVTDIAKKLNKTPAQILLKWILKRGVATIPKSTNADRLRQNLNLFNFDLNNEDMHSLNNLDKGLRVCNFGFFPGVNKHPEFPW